MCSFGQREETLFWKTVQQSAPHIGAYSRETEKTGKKGLCKTLGFLMPSVLSCEVGVESWSAYFHGRKNPMNVDDIHKRV